MTRAINNTANNNQRGIAVRQHQPQPRPQPQIQPEPKVHRRSVPRPKSPAFERIDSLDQLVKFEEQLNDTSYRELLVSS